MKRGTAAKVILGKDTIMDVPAGIVHGTDVILGGKAGLLNDFGGLVLSNNLMIGKKVSRGTITTVTVRGVAPIILPDAIAGSLQAVKAFGGTEQRSLPQSYQQLVSLTTDSASYFDTDYIINSFDVDVTTDAAMTLLASGPNMLWGFMGTSSNLPRWGVGSYTNNWLYGANTTTSVAGVADTNRHVTTGALFYNEGDIPCYKFVVDSVEIAASGTSNAETITNNTLSTFVGARNNRGTAGNFNPSTFYSFKIKKAGELVVNMVPAKRLSDNVVGFYDTVRDRFFTNAGTGTITAGDAAVPTPDTPMDIISNNGVVKVRHQSGLPLGYTLLDYIESTGTQYINTGYIPTSDIVEYGIEIYGTPDNSSSLFGAEAPAGNPKYAGVPFTSGGTTKVYIGGASSIASVSIPDNQWNKYVLQTTSSTAGKVTLNGVDTVFTYTNGIIKTLEIYLFANNRNNSATQLLSGQVKSFYIKDNGTLVRNFVAAKDSNNIVGMYDLVSGQFFTNAGTGDFVAGSTVSDPVEIYTDGTVETINAHGKNLFNKNGTLANGYYKPADGDWVASAAFRTQDYIKASPNTNYALTVTNLQSGGNFLVMSAWDSEHNWLGTVASNIISDAAGTSITITGIAPTNTAYLSVSVAINFRDINTLQLEKGSAATEYAPYYDGGTATTEMLLKVGDYQDVQSIIDGAVTRNVGIKVFDGTETISAASDYYQISNAFLCDSDDRALTICSHYKYGTVINYGEFRILTNGSTIRFNIGTFTTASEVSQWLADQYAAGTPVIIVYPLATPTTESVTGQTLQVTDGDNTLEITQASLDGLELEATYKSLVQLTIQEVEDANLNNNVEVTIS